MVSLSTVSIVLENHVVMNATIHLKRIPLLKTLHVAQMVNGAITWMNYVVS